MIERGIPYLDAPNMMKVEIDNKGVFALISMSHNYVIIWDTFRSTIYKDVYYYHTMDEYTNAKGKTDMKKFIRNRIKKPGRPAPIEMIREFKKWKTIYENTSAKWNMLRVRKEKS